MSSNIAVDEGSPVRLVNVSQLQLDVRNPRRTSRDAEVSQLDLLREMHKRFDLDDLLASLATYGYFSEEPLIAVSKGSEIPDEPLGTLERSEEPDALPSTSDGSEYLDQPPFIVVEGNRRLAALRILLFKR